MYLSNTSADFLAFRIISINLIKNHNTGINIIHNTDITFSGKYLYNSLDNVFHKSETQSILK